MLLIDFCNRLVDTCTCILDRAKPEAGPLSRRARSVEVNPGGQVGSGGVRRRSTELREAAARRFGRGCPLAFASALRLCGRRPFLGGNRSSPLGSAPPDRAALSSARRVSTPLSDALAARDVRATRGDPRILRPRPPPAAPRQRCRIERPPDAFHRRMSARPGACAPHLERGPATRRRFCHRSPGFRRSFACSPRRGVG